MGVPQGKFREIVFQILYSQDTGPTVEDDMMEMIVEQLKVSSHVVQQAFARMRLIWREKEELDQLIQQVSKGYSFDRIKSVERNILRLATYEMIFDEKIPDRVAIAEAVRLCRKFSTAEAASFVNALLDAILRKSLNQNQGDGDNLSAVDKSAQALIESEQREQQTAQDSKKETTVE